MNTQPGQVVIWEEIHVGTRRVFEEAGLHRGQPPDAAASRDANRLCPGDTEGET